MCNLDNCRCKCKKKKKCSKCPKKKCKPSPKLIYANYFAVPPDTTTVVSPGMNVPFPLNGPSSGDEIVRINDSMWCLPYQGDYEILWQVPVDTAGQFQVRVNGIPVQATIAQTGTPLTQITGVTMINALAGSTLEIINPAPNPPVTLSQFLANTTSPAVRSLNIKFMSIVK